MAAEAVCSGVASSVTESIIKPAIGCIGQEVRYVFKYQSYIDDLIIKAESLEYERERVKRTVEIARSQGDVIFDSVEQWMDRVDKFTGEIVKPIIENEVRAKKRCFKGLCPNLTTRYALSKKADKAATDCTSLLANGSFSDVSYRPVLQRTESVYVRGYEAFDSRIPVLGKIMDALADANVNMVGVYGMGGVGKTTLVNKVAAEVGERNLFDIVVWADVTITPDLGKIRGQIADSLGLVFQEESEEGRANRLRDRLKKEKGRVLIILDNVWEKIDLDAVGIPIGNHQSSDQRLELWHKTKDDKKFCKILVTSRNFDVLRNQMDAQEVFSVDPLSNNEAKDLFEKIVGNKPEMSDYQPTAAEIVGKCGGVPLVITNIANLLKNKSPPFWKAILDELRGSNPRSISGNETLELSYRHLDSKEAKRLFMLCGLLSVGQHRDFESLLMCGMGLGLFDDVDTLEKGKNKLQLLIDILKASCLLLDGDNNLVRMHDVILVVATSIASTNNMFKIQDVTGLKKRLEEEKDSIAVSLFLRDIHDDEIPERLTFRKLELFFLLMEEHSLKIPERFLEEMKELKVLYLQRIRFPSLASSLCCLINLRSLCFNECMLGDIAVIGELKKLEVLIFRGSDIKKLPKEIGGLTGLKLLNLARCSKLKVIAPNVISRLSQLEELDMSDTLIQWEVAGTSNQEPSNASIAELKQLPRLTTLSIHVPNAQIVPDGKFYENLERYNIFIGDAWNWCDKFETPRMLKLKISNRRHLGYGIKILLERAEDLYLDELNGVKNVLYELDRKGFSRLKHLHVQNGSQLLYIVDLSEWVPNDPAFPILESLSLRDLINLEEVCHGELHAASFSKLRSIKIENCDRLTHLFSVSMSRNLSQLQELEVSNCKILEEIVAQDSEQNLYQNDRNDRIIVFSQLRSMTLKCLPKLRSFGVDMKKPLISHTSSATSPGCKEIVEEDEPEDFMARFGQKVVLPRLESLNLSFINSGSIWLDQPSEMSSFSQNLTNLVVEECSCLKFLFSYSMVKNLAELRKLVLRNCKSMEVVINTEGMRSEKKTIDMSFPKLLHMELIGLSNLTTFGLGDFVEFPLLKVLQIESCTNLNTFFSSSSCVRTVSEECQDVNNIENCPTDMHPLFDGKVAFPSMEKMVLKQLDKMQLIWHNQLHADSFCKLKEVKVQSCEKIMTIVSSNAQGLLAFQNLERIEAFNCWSMKSLFSDSVAASLLQLKHIEAFGCGLEEIVAMEEGERDLGQVFPNLITVKLGLLPELKCFYKGFYTTEWPMLRVLFTRDCPKIQLFGSRFFSFQKTGAESQSENSIQEPLLLLEKAAPNLEAFSLSGDDLKSISLSQISTDIFDKLKALLLDFFENEYAGLPYGFLRRFHCLETLDIRRNDVKELFQYELGVDEGKHDVGFMNIKHLILFSLPYLERIWDKDSKVRPFFPELESMKVTRCHRLIYLMPSSASLENLTHLEVSSCDRLANILTCSLANGLVQLTTMEISYCKLVTKVLAHDEHRKEEEIVFRKLKVLKLRWLSSLTCFCLANCTLEFPCLEKVKVVECPKLEIFCAGVLNTPMLQGVECSEKIYGGYIWSEDLNSTIQQFCFCNMAHLQVSAFTHLKDKWNGQLLPVNLFCNLRSLVVDESSEISSAIPYNLLCYLNNLEKLEVESCDSVKEVFDLGGQLDADGQIWKKSRQKISAFNNLKSLSVYNCNSLRYIFTPVVILGLVQLEEIKIIKCAVIEEIISKERVENAATEKIIIPQLKTIWLELLPKLTSLYSGSNILVCPCLKSLSIFICERMERIVFTNAASLFNEKVVLPEKLNLSLIGEWIGHNQLLAESSCFQNITSLNMHGCDNLKYLFSFSVVKSLVQLKNLEISNCKFLEGVIDEEERISDMVLFPKLYGLTLKDLPKLTSFCNFNGDIIELSLSELCFGNCPSMKTFISNFSCSGKTSSKEPEEVDSEQNLNIEIQPFFDKKVRLPSLKRLTIRHMNELRKIWEWKEDSQPCSACQELAFLEVSKCDSLVNLMTSSTAKSVVNLTQMCITDCEMIEEIIVPAGDEVTNQIVFDQLEHLELERLPSLTSFFLGTDTLIFPSLERLTVSKCWKMWIFSQGELRTPKLQRVKTKFHKRYCWEGDLNSTIQHVFKEKGTHATERSREIREQSTSASPLNPVSTEIESDDKMTEIESEDKMTEIVSEYEMTEIVSEDETTGSGSLQTDALPRMKPGPNLSVNEAVKRVGVKSIEVNMLKIFEQMSDAATTKIGVHGIGGVGKTTLLKALISHPKTRGIFDVIILVTVSRYWSTRKIQNDVIRQLSLSHEDSETDSQVAEKLFQVLEGKKFLLLLDDLSDKVDLEKVGIPDPSSKNSCKILMASRNLDAFRDMGAVRVIKVETISWHEAWELFHEQVGGIVDLPGIQPFARAIVKGCGGLPLLIIITGRALTEQSDVSVWKQAAKEFSLPSTTAGIYHNECVTKLLKFGFDQLKDHDIKSCFIHCCLFPEDQEINTLEFIKYCIREGIIAGTWADAHRRGDEIIAVLVRSSMLQYTEGGDSIIVHDSLRDLALGILSSVAEDSKDLLRTEGSKFLLKDYSRLMEPPCKGNSLFSKSLESSESSRSFIPEGNQFLLRVGASLTQPPSDEVWKQAKMIFLTENNLCSLPKRPSCPELLTLFLQRNYQLRVISPFFFDCMTSLRVLNLSNTKIISLPESLFNLKNLLILILRDCEHLIMLPHEVGSLDCLEVLDLRGTEINDLPNSICKLESLRHLEVTFYGSTDDSGYDKLPRSLISSDIISRLRKLETLSIVVSPGDKRWYEDVKYLKIEISNLMNLRSLCFHFPEVEHVKDFLKKSTPWKEQRITEFKLVVGHDVKCLVSRVPARVDYYYNQQDRCLRFVNGEKKPDEVLQLLGGSTAFYLDHHLDIESLSDFGVSNLNGLKFCIISECSNIKAIVNVEERNAAVCPSLETLSINHLFNLDRIWVGTLPEGSFAELGILSLRACLNLEYVFRGSMVQSLSKLKELSVEDCLAIKEIVEADEISSSDCIILPSLKKLTLHYLPRLSNIWSSCWPSVEYISICGCPSLKKVSMDSNLKHSVREIKAEKTWWDELQWEDTQLRSHLEARFTRV